jgi:hypothetical protein
MFSLIPPEPGNSGDYRLRAFPNRRIFLTLREIIKLSHIYFHIKVKIIPMSYLQLYIIIRTILKHPAAAIFFCAYILMFHFLLLPPLHAQDRLQEDVLALSAPGDRSIGTSGCRKAAAFIRERFSQIGMEEIGSHRFLLPVLRHAGSTITVGGKTFPIRPFRGNAITPQSIGPEGISAPLHYAGKGSLREFNGRKIEGSVILMDTDSGKNWLQAANLGAQALIYIDEKQSSKFLFAEKYELSPIHFPRFWMQADEARKIFGDYTDPKWQGPQIRLQSDIFWENGESENIYGLITGTDPGLKEELLIIEAFYDTDAYIPGNAPAAEEALGIASLLALGHHLKMHPPGRSILLTATAGHARSLAGMRELIWSIRHPSKNIRKEEKRLKKIRNQNREYLEILEKTSLPEFGKDPKIDQKLKKALDDRIKSESDILSRQLLRLRMGQKGDENQQQIQALAQKRFLYRRLGWRTDFADLSPAEKKILENIIPKAAEEYRQILSDTATQRKCLKSAKRFRSLVKDKELAAVISLHLSSRGDGLGAFNYGWLYGIKSNISRIGAYSMLDELLRSSAARQHPQTIPFWDSLRPSAVRSWQSYFADRPPLGGEVAALAGYLGLTLATVHDARPAWGTPYDLPEHINWEYAKKQMELLRHLLSDLSRAPEISSGDLPRNGFATLRGQTKLLRHGELFPDQAAGGAMLLTFQGSGQYHAFTDSLGFFEIRGLATKKLVPDKSIVEGYRFDRGTGQTLWAIDKKQTGKNAYRVKMNRHHMETSLVMFPARQTTVFDLLEPRTFRYMTKLGLLDGRREALPMRYWYSRIDTRSSTICSIYLEPGTRFKLTHSDTLIRKKMLLLNADENNPEGKGYRTDDMPRIHRTSFRVARDMWTLLEPRIENLEAHGIYNERIRDLRKEGTASLKEAEISLQQFEYDRFYSAAARSWALASRVYNHVEKTQKDVLFGVLFYIALFVPFAFCAERLLFCYTDIHKRIIAFFAILLLLTALICRVHPAFDLAYSPTVVILAFFIMGLSLMVSLIIFFRFEQEMLLLQRRAKEMRAEEISRWKAFTAAFFLGVSNLRRRRIRTALTCATLIILTFTIMSFTSVSSVRQQSRFFFQKKSPWPGFLLKNTNWTDLPPETLEILNAEFGRDSLAAPRVWLEDADRTRAKPVPLHYKEKMYEARGMIGLCAQEPQLSGLDRILTKGRWFRDAEQNAVLLPEHIARNLGIDPDAVKGSPEGIRIRIWGESYLVAGIFSGSRLEEMEEPDGEYLSPVIFPSEISEEMTEAEMDALESGEDIQAFQSRYEHIPGNQTIIVPYRKLMAQGGHLKSVALRPENAVRIRARAEYLADRFGLLLFSGEKEGSYIYHAGDTFRYSGLPNIFIPLLISVLIVLNTMIGAVYERKGEISIYTSVGLAPSHVSFLFIAEALAFAVLSVVLGYLLAQVSAGLFAGSGLWAGITVNYSSLAGVGSMILVILVVLISVIYPSRVAAEIAIPDVNRSWSLPDTADNRIELTLPFLVRYAEHDSVSGFMLSWFQGHQDVSHGIFSTGKIESSFACPPVPGFSAGGYGNAPPASRKGGLLIPSPRRGEEQQSVIKDPLPPPSGEGGRNETASDGDGGGCDRACIQLDVRIWLAPFDFGIMQTAEIRFCPSDENPEFLEIFLTLTRESGEVGAWKRISKSFLNELRKQLLVWRSLDEEVKKEYESLNHDLRDGLI